MYMGDKVCVEGVEKHVSFACDNHRVLQDADQIDAGNLNAPVEVYVYNQDTDTLMMEANTHRALDVLKIFSNFQRSFNK